MIRQARKEDAVKAAWLIEVAIGHIANMLTGEDEVTLVRKTLADYFSQDVNRLSYTNTLVYEVDGDVAGIAIAYLGADSERLDMPLYEHVRFLHPERHILFDKEADDSDFYLDTLCVDETYRGQGIGTKLMLAFEEEAARRGFKTVALNASYDNPKATALYERSGYVKTKTIPINGHDYYYMVKSL